MTFNNTRPQKGRHAHMLVTMVTTIFVIYVNPPVVTNTLHLYNNNNERYKFAFNLCLLIAVHKYAHCKTRNLFKTSFLQIALKPNTHVFLANLR